MLFTLQKIIWFIVVPPGCIIFLLVSGLLLSRRRSRLGHSLMAAGVLLLYLLSLNPVSDFLLTPLESAAPPLTALPADVAAVVVPGGGSVDLSWIGSGPLPNAETYTRLVKGVELAKKLDVPLVLTGGNGEPFATTLKDAQVMAKAAITMGMPTGRIIVEDASRNTLENSHAVRRLVKGDRIVLATSAYYMKRAMAMFRRRGFTVIPAPVYHQVQTRMKGAAQLIPRAGSFAASAVALAEWMSMGWWRARGEI